MPDRAADRRSFALFDTALGRCGVAWSERGITRIALPGETDAATREHLARATPGAVEDAPPPAIAAVIARIVQHVGGAPGALDTIALDMTGVSAFHQQVYDAARAIPSGQTLSYGALATRLGMPGAARAIGQAMGRNPFPIVVPCHRVLAARHGTGGFSAHGGVATKARLLAAEGVRLATQPELPFAAPAPPLHDAPQGAVASSASGRHDEAIDHGALPARLR